MFGGFHVFTSSCKSPYHRIEIARVAIANIANADDDDGQRLDGASFFSFRYILFCSNILLLAVMVVCMYIVDVGK